MNQNASYQLECVKENLDKAIAELDNIVRGLKGDFQNIGTDTCAECISRVLEQYRYVRRQLNNVNIANIKENI